MRNLQIEALFGGALALFVIIAVGVALTNSGITRRPNPAVETDPVPVSANVDLSKIALASSDPSDLVCECYDKAFSLATKVDVESSEYRTGFVQCRARAGVDGGQAWTAGWNARLANRPFEASCRAYRRRNS